MGYKKVCFSCRKAFSLYLNDSSNFSLICPECGNPVTVLSHLFQPPKQNDIKKWKVAEYLKEHGFIYQHIFEINPTDKTPYSQYPETMSEAKEFVEKYSDQAFLLKWDDEKQEFIRTSKL